ncbi:myb-binding protein 1A-like protein [Pecten maximus]|uniref:myb-binding protein 1A-like protein n=1 Tax=Pecten maximus TaxID=6579 RepID=UPI00145820D7|nr:myb-binding protein 1A-like protein [Pecten maximus]
MDGKDADLMKYFWRLAEPDENCTVKNTRLLLKKLEASQKDYDSVGKDLKYTLRRLIKGVSSNRKCARQGFSVALCQILRKFTVISTEKVLALVTKHLQLSKKDGKAETGSILLGRTMVYLALIQSGRLAQDSTECIKTVVSNLQDMKRKRSYLQQISIGGIAHLIPQIDTEKFQEGVLPCIQKELMLGWDKCTPDALLLLLVCHKHHKSLIGKTFLKEHWSRPKIITEKNFDNIWQVVLKSSETYPVIHPVTSEVLEHFVKSDVSVADFWSCSVNMLFCSNHTRSTNLGLHILGQIIPHIKTPGEAESVWCPTVLSVLVRHIDKRLNKDNPIHTMASQVTNSLITYLQQCEDGKIQHAVLTKLFDLKGERVSQEMYRVIDRISLNLTSEGAVSYGNFLMKYFADNIERRDNQEDQWSRKVIVRMKDVISEVRNLVTLKSTCTDHDRQLHLLQFLAVHSYWVVSKPTKIVHCTRTNRSIDTVMRKHIQDNFFKALNSLLMYKTEKSKSTSVIAYINTTQRLMQYMQTLMQSDNAAICLVTDHHNKIPKNLNDNWNKVLETVESVQTKHLTDDSDKMSTSHAFLLLLFYNFTQLLVDPASASSHLEDVYGCLENAFKSKRKSVSKKSPDEPDWIEVMTELLVSMMSQGSVLARTTATDVYMALADHITPASVQLIIDVLMADDKEGNDDLVSFENNDQDDVNDEMDGVEEGDGEEDGESEEEESESSESEEEGLVDEVFRLKLRSALGPAADVEESDSEDDEDMSDSQMFKLDGMIAAVFKNMRQAKAKESKDNKKQMLAFKIRLLDLLIVLAKEKMSADVVMELNLPLLELMLNGEKKKEERALGQHAQKLSQLMYRQGKELLPVNLDKEAYTDRIMDIIHFSTRPILSQSLVNSVSDACLLVIRLFMNMSAADVGPSPVRTRSHKGSKKEKANATKTRHEEVLEIITDNLNNCLHGRSIKDKTDRDLHLNPSLFLNIFTKYPVLFWDVTSSLVEVYDDSSVKVYNKTQASAMLVNMLNKDVVEKLGEEVWTEFASSTFATLTKVICGTTKDNYFEKLMHNILQILIKISSLAGPAQVSIQGPDPAWVGIHRPGQAWVGIQGPGPSQFGVHRPGQAWVGIRGSGPSRVGIQGPGPAWVGIQGPGSAWVGIHGPGPSRVGVHRPGSAWVGIHRPGQAQK